MKKFCPKCGKTVIQGNFCNDCNPETIDFKPISIKLCPSKSVFIQGKWSKFEDFLDVSKRVAKKFIKQEVIIEKSLDIDESLFSKPGLQKIFEMEVERNGKIFKIPVNVEITLSPAVSKVGSTYFEGILQLRNARGEVKEYVNNYTKKHEIYINKVVDKGKDVDYFFVRKKQLTPLALKLMRNFGAVIENSAQLFSRNRLTSKDIFRVNVLVTLPNFISGDVIDVEDHPFFVKEMNKIITGVNLITGKKTTIRNEEATHIKALEKFKAKITITRPEIQVVDPSTYEQIVLKNPLGITVVPDQNVVFVKHHGNGYLIK
ncbi:MAG: NMD3-related protein [Candidatus Nanoarchaeia archaeon]